MNIIVKENSWSKNSNYQSRHNIYLRRPVEHVCCPRTRIPHQWRKPRWARIFFKRSISSRSLASTFWAKTWVYFPVLKSFCLFKNQRGILNCRGFWIIATSFSISSAVSSPARLFTSISAFLQIKSVNRRPRPLIFVIPKTTFRFPSTLVLRIRRMCWNSAPWTNELDLIYFQRWKMAEWDETSFQRQVIIFGHHCVRESLTIKSEYF